jgi:glucokinase
MPASCVVGIDLGGTKLLAGAVDAGLTVHHRAHRTVRGLDQRALLDAIVAVVQEMQAVAELPVLAVGCGIPCTFDRARGIAVQAANSSLRDLAFEAVMTERLGLPVIADNDANAAIVAEHRAGAASGTRDAAMLTIGTGIGGGLILDGRLYRGSLGAGAELGHMVVDVDGPRCQGN